MQTVINGSDTKTNRSGEVLGEKKKGRYILQRQIAPKLLPKCRKEVQHRRTDIKSARVGSLVLKFNVSSILLVWSARSKYLPSERKRQPSLWGIVASANP